MTYDAPDARRQATIALLPVAISVQGERMLLHFSALSDVLSTMHDVPADLREATRSRLKYFAKRSFPLPGKTRGKAKIGLDDALKLAFAFELLQAGMGPLRALRLTSTDWPLISRTVAGAWRAVASRSEAVPQVRILPRALAEMAAPEKMREVPLSEVVGTDAPRGDRHRVSIMVDVAGMIRAFGLALIADDEPRLDRAVRPGEFERAMDAYADQVLGKVDPRQMD